MKAERKGFTNGMGKGKQQKTEGFTNGQGKGLTNGAGKGNQTDGIINGFGKDGGFVNGAGKGSGYTNGMALSVDDEKDGLDNFLNYRNRKSNIKAKTIGVIGIIAIIFMMFIPFSNILEEPIYIRVDGDFRDWGDMEDIGFARFGIQKKSNTSLMMALERPDILKGNGNITEAYLILINDVNSEKGFYIGYDTYEYYIDIFGKNDTVYGATGYEFDGTRNNTDWNGFISGYSPFNVKKANNNSMMEIGLQSIKLGRTDFEDMQVLIYHFNSDGSYEYSRVIDVEDNIGGKVENTRSSDEFFYVHDWDNNELHIYTNKSLAYSSIPYEIRIIDDKPNEDTTWEDEEETPEQEPEVMIRETVPKERGTTLLIEYDFHRSDIIRQCGGIILDTTANATLDDNGFHLFNVNRTVLSIRIEGDMNFNIRKIYTRNELGNLLISNDGGNNDNNNPANATHFYANGLNITEEIILDGIVDDDAWSGDEIDHYTMDSTRDFDIYMVRDYVYLYIGIVSTNDGTVHVDDECHIYFDTANLSGSSPSTNSYKRLSITNTGTVTYYEGSGSGWNSQTIPDGWTATKSTTNGVVSWEFEVLLSDLDENGNFGEQNETIGFGTYVRDWKDTGGGTYRYNMWYPDNYYDGKVIPTQYMNDPSEWSDLTYGEPIPLYLGTITDMTAREYDTTEQDITVNGVLSEYFWNRHTSDAYRVDLTRDIVLWTVRNSTHLFIGVNSIHDSTVDATDSCSVYFDLWNYGNSFPNNNTYKRITRSGGATTYFVGSGTGWTSTTLPSGWSASKSTTGGTVTFEFRIKLSDLNISGRFNEEGEDIGFGVRNRDYATSAPPHDYYIWYPDAYYSGTPPPTQYMSKPDTWADLNYGADFTGTEFEDYDVVAQDTTGTITIDGDLDESEWSNDAFDWQIICGVEHEVHLYTMKDATYLYVGFTADNYNIIGGNDFCQIYFDTDVDKTIDPDTSDKLLQIDDANATAYFEGTGSGWGSQTIPTNWAGKNGMTDGNISWEARFTLSELDEGGNFGANGEYIGFGITVGLTQQTPTHTISFPDACEPYFEMVGYKYHPESWGEIYYTQIPEFENGALMIVAMLGVVLFTFTKRRDKKDDEEGGGLA